MNADFCPELETLLRSRRAVGTSGRVFENLIGTSTPNNLHVIRSLMRDRPSRTLETGFAFGASCLTFTASHRENRSAPARQHVAIDPLQRTLFDGAGLLAVERSGLAGFLDFRGEPSALVLPQLVRDGEKFDLIYIDGSHFFEEILIDAYYCIRLLNEGGVMLFDDSTIGHVAKVVRFLRTNQSHCLAEVDLSAHRADGGSLKYRAAKLLGRVQLTAFRRAGALDDRRWNIPLVEF
jgi:predicted O-methyltransferase YrrM